MPGLPFDGETLKTKSLGGAETAGYYMARELRRLGHHVTVFSNTPQPGMWEGVEYRPLPEWQPWVQTVPHDIAIVQRWPEAMAQRTNARLNLLWCHDLALGRHRNRTNGVIWNVDRALLLSAFMVRQYQEVYDWPEGLAYQTRNGIDLSLFANLPDESERDRYRLIYAARPERGLDLLLTTVFPRLLREEPRLTLALVGYDNPVGELAGFYRQIDAMVRGFADRVTFAGHLTKRRLYEEYARSGVYVYPTPGPFSPEFREISCITAMECQAASLPIVTSANGALPETIAPGAGVLLDVDPITDQAGYVDQFAAAVLRYVRDDDAYRAAQTAGRERARTLDWAAVAEDWSERFDAWIAERNDSPQRLFYHFVRRSDIVAANAVIDRMETVDQVEAEAALAPWTFARRGEFREQYERIGKTHTDVFDQVRSESRYTMLRDWLTAHPEIKRVLDVGCAHGAYAVNLANEVGRQWVGIDIDRFSIAVAEKTRAERAAHPELLRFRVGDHTVDLSDEEPFDLLWIGETLEHVPEPWAFVDALERWVRPGGMVLITVPHGPWEHMSYQTYPHRCHIWEYDQHDIRDMFAGKKQLSVHTTLTGKSSLTAETLGHHIINYMVDGSPCGRIDMARKLRLQRPRQTLSANLMLGPDCEDALHWCLRSIRDIADEIVVADCGLSDEARRILGQYPVRIVSSQPPGEIGFEGPRNIALAASHMDWVLWIDSDEKLLGLHLGKYLRGNIFQGYSIRQHHFAADTTFEPDIPVRCFRRLPGMRFYGMIHEHPEDGLNKGPGLTVILGDVHIAHLGYLIEDVRRQRFARNLPMLQRDLERYPDRILQKHFLMRDSVLLCVHEMQMNGGSVTPAIRARCRNVVDLYRKHFLGKTEGFVNVDSLEYYSQALRILAEGFEVTFQVDASRDGPPPGKPLQYRFASRDDLERELAARAAKATAPLTMTPW